METHLGSLPPLLSQNSLSARFKNFGVSPAKKGPSLYKSPALPKSSQRPNGSQWVKRRVMPEAKDGQDDPQNPVDYSEMPALELVTHKEPESDGGAPAQATPPLEPNVLHAVPFEMRSLFLLQMLKACFREASWLLSVSRVSGPAAILVTGSFPQAPFFWGIRITKECHPRMEKLFRALVEAESRAPLLTADKKAPLGSGGGGGPRCLAPCLIGEEGTAWNRAWIVERVEDLAVVFFVDFGQLATLPLTSLRKLEEDEWWSIGPLAQPFVLQGEVFPPEVMMRRILKGTLDGPLEREPHILQFSLRGGFGEEIRKDGGEEAATKSNGNAHPPPPRDL
ncbi:tudor domain-containing protein 10 [Anolis sagrei]|uniref:tudor domain-containing protein 10 n=1 Tax=Anolis sagrei TaxID=38937 RepID=UPI0035223E0E